LVAGLAGQLGPRRAQVDDAPVQRERENG
jgi:hypothetical protein